MPRLIRPLLAVGLMVTSLSALGGCVAAPQPVAVPPGSILLGQTCSAGFYQCPVGQQPVGTPCSCPGLGAPSYGTVR